MRDLADFYGRVPPCHIGAWMCLEYPLTIRQIVAPMFRWSSVRDRVIGLVRR